MEYTARYWLGSSSIVRLGSSQLSDVQLGRGLPGITVFTITYTPACPRLYLLCLFSESTAEVAAMTPPGNATLAASLAQHMAASQSISSIEPTYAATISAGDAFKQTSERDVEGGTVFTIKRRCARKVAN